MGRERARTGQLVHFCIACIALLLLAGCAVVHEAVRDDAREEQRAETAARKPRQRADERESKGEQGRAAAAHLQSARKLLVQGDPEGVLRESQKALALAGKNPPADEALFTMGLAFVHYKSSHRDYKQSIDAFRRLVREYPQSPLAEQARIWVGVLQVIEQSKQVDIEIEEMKKELNR